MIFTALDSVGQPDPNDAQANGYLFVAGYIGTAFQRFGTSRPYIDSCLNAGIGFLPIFEEWASQFLGGYAAGVNMMSRMRTTWDWLALPNDGTVSPAIALVDPNPGAVPGNEAALIEFAHGIDDACWLPSWTGYGSKYGLDVVRGSGVASKMTRRWGVGTWGFGERPDGSMPDDVDADMIQHGNRTAALPGCDHNTVFRYDMGQLGGEHDMPLTDADKEWLTLMVTAQVASLLGINSGGGETLSGNDNLDGSSPTIAQVVGDVNANTALTKKIAKKLGVKAL